MSLMTNLRRGEGPFWGRLKALIKGLMHCHLPVFWLTRPLFSMLYALHVGVGVLWGGLLRFFWYEPLFRSQCESVGTAFRLERIPYIQGEGRIIIGDHVTFDGQPAFVFGNRSGHQPEVVIGDHTYIGHATSLTTSRSIHIGRHCLIAGGVQIADYDGHPVDAYRRRAGEPTPPENIRPVVIGNDVWIGTGACILKGVTIGDRAVIGAHAVVTRDVPPDTVVAGNPAQVVKYLEAVDEEVVAALANRS